MLETALKDVKTAGKGAVRTAQRVGRDVKTTANSALNTAKDKATTGADKVLHEVDSIVDPHKHDETIHSKGGTTKGFDQAERMVSGDAQQDATARFGELGTLLFRTDLRGQPKLRRGSLELFNKITPRLAGGGVLKSMGGQTVGGMTLEQALRDAFKDHLPKTGEYLVDALHNDGVPSMAMQIADAAGKVSVQQYNRSLVEHLVHDLTPEQVVATYKDYRRRVGRPPTALREANELHGAGEKYGTKKKSGARTGRAKTAWLDSWDERLAALLVKARKKQTTGAKKARKGKTKAKGSINAIRDAFAEALGSEFRLEDLGAITAHVLKPGSKTLLELDKFSFLKAGEKERIKEALAAAQLDPHLLPDPPDIDTTPTTDVEELEHRKEQRHEANVEKALRTLNVNLFRAGIAHKGAPGEEQQTIAGLLKLVAKMEGDDRRAVIASYMDTRQATLYMNPSAPIGLRDQLFTDTWTKTIRPAIEDVLFDDKKKAKIDAAVAKGKVDKAHLNKSVIALHSYFKFPGEEGPHYLALVKLNKRALGQKVSTTTHGTRIWEIVQRMKGAELYQLRSDQPLLLGLRNNCKKDVSPVSKKQWDKVVEMLQLAPEYRFKPPKTDQDGNAVTPPPKVDKAEKPVLKLDDLAQDDVGHGGAKLGTMKSSEAVQSTVDKLEFTPAYWAKHLHRLVKHLDPDKGEVYSIIARAQIVAKRWVKAQDDPTAHTEVDFLKQVLGAMKESDQKRLEKNLPKAHAALATGTELTVAQRLKSASGHKLFGKYQTSLGTELSSVTGAFEDLSGRDLLEQWSNIDELKALKVKKDDLEKQIQPLQGSQDEAEKEKAQVLQGELQGVLDEMSRWWPSINRTRLAWLEQNTSGKTRTNVQGQLCAKLAGAMSSDSEFIEAAKEAGLAADDYDAERIRFGHVMNQRRQLDTGTQFGAKSAGAAYSMVYSAYQDPLAMGKFIRDGGNNRVNKTASQARKAQANIYLAQVRTTESRIRATERDTTLTDEQRKAKIAKIRERSAERIEETREELEKRNELFSKQRGYLEKAISRVLKILFVVAVGAATFGQGIVPAIIATILASIAKEAAGAVAKWVIEGDAFEHKDLAKAIAIGAVTGALKAASLNLLELLDAASALINFDPGELATLAGGAVWADQLQDAAIQTAWTSATVGMEKTTLKYFLEVEKPFRNFGRNLDLFLATQVTDVIAKQAISFFGVIGSQGSEDLLKLMGGPSNAGGPGVVGVAMNTFEQQAKGQVAGLVGRVGMLGKAAKAALKAMVKKLYGKYPELYKQLRNDSELAVADLQEEEDEADTSNLPTETELQELMALVDELAAGTKSMKDVSGRQRRKLGLLFRWGRKNGVEIP